jgi:N6-adenosine-specific RNA methylase IME4
MSTLKVSEIVVEDRHRRDMGDIAALAASIAEHGLLQAIGVRPDGRLVFGERRLRAHQLLGRTEIEVKVIDIEHIAFAEQAENNIRKDFTIEERVAIGEDIEKLLAGRQGRHHMENFPHEVGPTRDIAARKAGFSNGRTYEQAKEVIRAAAEDPKTHGKAKDTMNRTGRVHGSFKLVKVARQAAAIRAEPPPYPGRGPYRVIVADVPWPYNVRQEDPSHCGTLPYAQMSIEQICGEGPKVRAIAHADCILWFWVTNFHMRYAYDVLAAWDFEAKTILTWVKDHFGNGDWLRGQTEHCILATRGNPTVQLTNQSTVLHARRRAHSQKPDEFYAMVESLCPAPRYAYLFARNARPLWDGHGDEAPPAPDIAESVKAVVEQLPRVAAEVAEYDAARDLDGSLQWAYRRIRDRVARGGKGWGGYGP